MKTYKGIKTGLVTLAVAAAIVSCKKDDDDTTTLPSLGGSMKFDMEAYVELGRKMTLTPSGVYHPEGGGVGIYWSASWKDKADTTRLQGDDLSVTGDTTYTFPSEVGSYTVSCTAFASGYYSTTSSKAVIVVDTVNIDNTLLGLDTGHDSGKYESGSVRDDRDSRKYKTVKIGGYEWFAENLSYDGTDLSGNGEPADKLGIPFYNCEAMSTVFGRYYTLNEISGNDVCPQGWKVADANAWLDLANTLSGDRFTEEDINRPFEGIAGMMMVDADFISENSPMWDYETWMNNEDDLAGDGDGTGLTGETGLNVLSCGFANIYETTDYDTETGESRTVRVGSFDSVFGYAALWVGPDGAAGGGTDDKAYYRYIDIMENCLNINYASMDDKDSFGASVRCVRAVQ